MNCPQCNTEMTEGAKFCSKCGIRLVQDTICPGCGHENKPRTNFCGKCGASNASMTSNVESSDYKKTEQSRKRRVFKGKAGKLNGAATMVEQLMRSENLEIQVVNNTDQIIIQGRKPPAWYIMLLGLDIAASVTLTVTGNDLISEIGGAKWMDKAAGVAIAWFIFGPVILATVWGAYMQNVLFNKIDNALIEYLV